MRARGELPTDGEPELAGRVGDRQPGRRCCMTCIDELAQRDAALYGDLLGSGPLPA